jgi:BirA family biotin operon repressor/biotin-[acetyl-CoA-carboxylase] ligase
VTRVLAWPPGYDLRHFVEIDSTNAEARRMAQAGMQGPVWIFADRQSDGRGRRGRAWVSPAGNLSATLLFTPTFDARTAGQLAFVTALAASDLFRAFAPEESVRVKWPNDILLNGRKAAGILLESAGQGGALDWMAVGIGANLRHHPDGMEFPATSLANEGFEAPPAADALDHLAAAWAHWYGVWGSEGFVAIRQAWCLRASGIGRPVRARLPQEETTGIFDGIDESGALLLRQDTQLRAISAADIFF